MTKNVSAYRLKKLDKDFWLTNTVYIAAVAFIVVLSITNPKFMASNNIINIFKQSSVLMIISIGMALTMITKGIDMSVGAVVYLSAALMQSMGSHGWSAISMCIAGILIGTFTGLINGVIASTLRIYPLLSTLATMYAARGVGLLITGGGAALMPMFWRNLTNIKVLYIPLQIYVAILLAVAVQIFLYKTSFGRHIYAVGDNEKTAHEKGISAFRVKLFAYTVSGFMCGVAAIISTSQVMSAPISLGLGQEFYAIIAAVLGGVSLFGGKGTVVPGVIIGALIMSVISNSLVLTGASPYLYSIVYACVILVVVLFDTLKNRQAR